MIIIKVIDLLNKIANGEEVPERIKWGCHDFKWFVYEYMAKEELEEPTLLDYLSQCPQMLNDVVEIIEDKKIDTINWKSYGSNLKELNKNIDDLANKINEIIDYINKGE